MRGWKGGVFFFCYIQSGKLDVPLPFFLCQYETDLDLFKKIFYFILNLFIFCMRECVLACMFVHQVSTVSPEGRKRHWIFWDWSDRWLLAAMWLLGIKRRSSEKAASAINN